MFTLCLLILAGFVVGSYLRLGGIAAASMIVLLVWAGTKISIQTITLVDVLMLFAYLSALQGGFCIGASTATRWSR